MYYGRDGFVIRMAGSSMEPFYRDGDFLYVDPDEPAADGRFVGVEDAETGERTIRQYFESEGRRVLRAARGDWPEVVLDRETTTMILGVVVFEGRAV